jgi:hypothetical protein
MSSGPGVKSKLNVGVGAGDDADSESRTIRMSSMTGGKWKLSVGIADCDGADSESLAVRMLLRGPKELIVGVADGNDDKMPSRELMTLTGDVGDGDDDNWRAIRIFSAT